MMRTLLMLGPMLLALSGCVTVTSPCLEWAPAVDTVRVGDGHLDTVRVLLCTKQGTPR